MIDPTREEWLAVRERFLGNVPDGPKWDEVVVAALGPCPPEPPPPRWVLDELEVEDADRGVWVGFADGVHQKLTPDEAEAMADALCAHAHHARKQGAASDA